MKYMFFYSGGKDSLATLLLSRAQWLDGDFEVVFVDTGNHFPETYAQQLPKMAGRERQPRGCGADLL